MTEFMEEGTGIIKTQQRWFALGKVIVVDDDGNNVAIDFALRAIHAHPRAAAFGGAGKIVVQKNADELIIRVVDFVGFYIRVIRLYIGLFGKVDTEQAMRAIEDSFDHAV